jgi:hypothetical protein
VRPWHFAALYLQTMLSNVRCYVFVCLGGGAWVGVDLLGDIAEKSCLAKDNDVVLTH